MGLLKKIKIKRKFTSGIGQEPKAPSPLLPTLSKFRSGRHHGGISQAIFHIPSDDINNRGGGLQTISLERVKRMGAQATLGDENPFSVEGRRLCVRPEVHVEQGKSCTGMSVDIGLQVLRPTTSAYPARKSGGPTNGNDHDGGGEDGSTRPGSGRVDSTDRAVFPDSGEVDYEGSGRDGVSRSKFDWLQRLLEKEDWFDFTLRETCGIGICRHQSRPRVRASNSSTQTTLFYIPQETWTTTKQTRRPAEFDRVGSNGLGAFGSCPIPDVNFLFIFFFFFNRPRGRQ